MRHSRKVSSALVVLTTGLAAACLFLKETADTEPLGGMIEPLVRQEANRGVLMELRASRNLVSRPPANPSVSDSADTTTPQISEPAINLSLFEQAAPAQLPRISDDYPQAAAVNLPEKTAESDSATPPPTSHKIVDGDTLAALAEKYLGDAGRQDELYAANQDVLSDPELLPIGAVLRIPARPRSQQ